MQPRQIPIDTFMENRDDSDFYLNAQSAFETIKVNRSGGLDQQQVQLALAYEFAGCSDVYVPPISAISGDLATLPLQSLAEVGYRQIVFTLQSNSTHQIAVCVVLGVDGQCHTVNVLDSQSSHSLTDDIINRLVQVLDVTPGQIQQLPSPFAMQTDDWSCGVYVIAMLWYLYNTSASARQSSNAELKVEEVGFKYYLNYLKQTAVVQKLESQCLNNKVDLRKLLDMVEERRYERGYYQNASNSVEDEFKTLADYLQGVVWGNDDRQESPADNSKRTMQALDFLLDQPLEYHYQQFMLKHKDTHSFSSLFFQTYMIFKNSPDLECIIDGVAALSDHLLKSKYTINPRNSYANEELSARDALLLIEQEIIQFTQSQQQPKAAYYELLSKLLCGESADPLLHCLTLIMQEDDVTSAQAVQQAITAYHSRMPLSKQYEIMKGVISYISGNIMSYDADLMANKSSMKVEQSAYLAAHQADEAKKNDFIKLMSERGVILPRVYTNNIANLKKILRQYNAITLYTNREFFAGLTDTQIEMLLSQLIDTSARHDLVSVIKLCPVKNKQQYLHALMGDINNINVNDRSILQYKFASVNYAVYITILKLIINKSTDQDLIDNAKLLLELPSDKFTVIQYDAVLMPSLNLTFLLRPEIFHHLLFRNISQEQIAEMTDEVIYIYTSSVIWPILASHPLAFGLLSLDCETVLLLNSPYLTIMLEKKLISIDLFIQQPDTIAKFLTEQGYTFISKQIFPYHAIEKLKKELSPNISIDTFITFSSKIENEIRIIFEAFSQSRYYDDEVALASVIFRNITFMYEFIPPHYFDGWSVDEIQEYIANIDRMRPVVLSHALNLHPQNKRDYVEQVLASFDPDKRSTLKAILDEIDYSQYGQLLSRVIAASSIQANIDNAYILQDNLNAAILSDDVYGDICRTEFLIQSIHPAVLRFMLASNRYRALMQSGFNRLTLARLLNTERQEVLEYLITSECDALIYNDRNFLGRALIMPLAMLKMYVAIKSDDVEKLQTMLAAGTNIDTATDEGLTLLRLACEDDDDVQATILIANGAGREQFYTSVSKLSMREPLCFSVMENGNIKLLAMLIDAKIDICVDEYLLPLCYAISRGRLDYVNFILQKGAVISNYNYSISNSRLMVTADHMLKKNLSPLETAVRYNYTEIARLLLQHGAEINQVGADDMTPLAHALANGALDVARLLLINGADVNKLSADAKLNEQMIKRISYLMNDSLLKRKDSLNMTRRLMNDKNSFFYHTPTPVKNSIMDYLQLDSSVISDCEGQAVIAISDVRTSF